MSRRRLLQAVARAADQGLLGASWRHEVSAPSSSALRSRALACLTIAHTRVEVAGRAPASCAVGSALAGQPAACFSAAAGELQAEAAAGAATGAAPESSAEAAEAHAGAAASAEALQAPAAPAAAPAADGKHAAGKAQQTAAAAAARRPAAADEGDGSPEQQQEAEWPWSAACRRLRDLERPEQVLPEVQSLLAAGQFGTDELASAMRLLDHQVKREEHQSAARVACAELIDAVLEAADSGRMTLDGRAVAYLVWGMAKMRLPRESPLRARVLPLVGPHAGSMRYSDVSSTIYSLGMAQLRPADDVIQALFSRAEETAGEAKTAHYVAMLVGSTRLQLDRSLIQKVVSRLETVKRLYARQVGNLASLLPLLGLSAEDKFPQLLFHQAGKQAQHLDPVGTTSVLWAAAKMGHQFEPGTRDALLKRLGQVVPRNQGALVPAVFWALGRMGMKVGEDGLTADLFQQCVRSQVAAMSRNRVQPQAVLKFLWGALKLGGELSKEDLEACLRCVEPRMKSMEPHALMLLDRAFRRFKFYDGCDACKHAATQRGLDLRQLKKEEAQHWQQLRMDADAGLEV